MRLEDYRALGGYMEAVRPIETIAAVERQVALAVRDGEVWPMDFGRISRAGLGVDARGKG